ncbi:MAG: hypothetical protein UW44_C0008G0108 [Candidatus Collierbacteria bacterium GW2011_GWB2_44_22]|uniref:Uncharacterized protein n=1 Tax=Candidatus Collierbacteria bacterium GW2011_GWB2_44_22 TaxID=1618387 RepID=A0A0G1HXD6_9BACT|nr:MAG: hypothetical protein UW31_C0021G0005 [Candidatus Collierbacteria bacterium GW2011_GWA2_44_13]KKT51786.1 MAG: hypothetical protein UW44_C0008G0108 [Candidatus Collierbacteria bacterium GW2011_GWB2_44_22]
MFRHMRLRRTRPPFQKSIRFVLLLAFLSVQFLFSTPAFAQNYCQPGSICNFPLGRLGESCRFNEVHFFESKGDSWVFPPGKYDFLTFNYGPFTIDGGGYQTSGGIEGGCVCDIATWINYVALINGFITLPNAKYHSTDIVGVPKEIGADGKSMYYVSIQHTNPKPDPGPNGEPVAWDADLRIENPSQSETWTIRWQLQYDQETQKYVSVNIWIEKGSAPLSNAPFIPFDTDSLGLSSASTTLPSANLQKEGLLRYLLYFFAGTFLLCFIFSNKFRRGSLTVLLILIPIILALLLIWPL